MESAATTSKLTIITNGEKTTLFSASWIIIDPSLQSPSISCTSIVDIFFILNTLINTKKVEQFGKAFGVVKAFLTWPPEKTFCDKEIFTPSVVKSFDQATQEILPIICALCRNFKYPKPPHIEHLRNLCVRKLCSFTIDFDRQIFAEDCSPQNYSFSTRISLLNLSYQVCKNNKLNVASWIPIENVPFSFKERVEKYQKMWYIRGTKSKFIINDSATRGFTNFYTALILI